MEIKDNAFSRQFETILDGKMISLEYSFQEKKIFLTKIHTPDPVSYTHLTLPTNREV